jgi:acetyltransferase
MTNDAQFGPMVTVGLGGVLAELLADTVTFQPPVSGAATRGYLEQLRGYRLLRGYRGRPMADIDALELVIERFSVLCATIGRMFVAIDLNPVIAASSGAFAVDALFLPVPTL